MPVPFAFAPGTPRDEDEVIAGVARVKCHWMFEQSMPIFGCVLKVPGFEHGERGVPIMEGRDAVGKPPPGTVDIRGKPPYTCVARYHRAQRVKDRKLREHFILGELRCRPEA